CRWDSLGRRRASLRLLFQLFPGRAVVNIGGLRVLDAEHRKQRQDRSGCDLTPFGLQLLDGLADCLGLRFRRSLRHVRSCGKLAAGRVELYQRWPWRSPSFLTESVEAAVPAEENPWHEVPVADGVNDLRPRLM